MIEQYTVAHASPRSEENLSDAASLFQLLDVCVMSRSDATPATTMDGLAIKSFEDVKDVVDFRLEKASRPSAEQLDEITARQLGDLVHGHGHHEHPHHGSDDPEKLSKGVVEEEPIYVSGAPSMHALSR